jgi:transposase
MRFDLSDEDWALLEPLLPKSRKSARVDDRKIMNAIFYVLRTGMPWRDLPARSQIPLFGTEVCPWASIAAIRSAPVTPVRLTKRGVN